MVSVVIFKYHSKNGKCEEIRKVFKTNKSLYSYLNKLERSSLYSSIEWHYENFFGVPFVNLFD